MAWLQGLHGCDSGAVLLSVAILGSHSLVYAALSVARLRRCVLATTAHLVARSAHLTYMHAWLTTSHGQTGT